MVERVKAVRAQVAASRVGGAIRSMLATPRRRVVAAAAAVAVMVATGGTAVYAASGDGDDRYRTAIAEIADVSETLSLTGHVAAATSPEATFQTDGTVAEVLVSLGDAVTAGQTIASLDPEALDDEITHAEDALARAEQQLEDHLEAQSSGSSTTGAGGAPTGAPSTSPPGGGAPPADGTDDPPPSEPGDSTPDPAVTEAIAAVAAAQNALLAQYDAVVQAQAASEQMLANAQATCEPFMNAALDPGTLPDEEGNGGSSGNLDELQQQLAQCRQALSQTQDTQEQTSAEQSALRSRAAELDAAVTVLQDALSASQGAAAPAASGQGGGTSAQSSAVVPASTTSVQASTSEPSTPQTTASITSETILADRAAIDAAEAALAIAERNRGFATLTAPIDGTVVSIGFAVGDSVSAGGAEASIVIQADDGYVVEATVPLSQIVAVDVGQTATVTLPASGTTYQAQVSAIGVLNVSETSTPSYTVTIAIDSAGDELLIGATAQIVVTLATASDVLTVPISALSRNGASSTVTILRDGVAEAVAVEIGATGTERVEIRSGVEEGDRAVLADLTLSIIDDEDDSSGGGLTGLGGSNGGGMSGSSFPGGGFPRGELPEGFPSRGQ